MRSRVLLPAALGLLGVALLVGPAWLPAKGGVYTQTRHADPATGAFRTPDWARGDCGQCHVSHDGASPNAFALFAPNTNALCYTSGCHSGNAANVIYQGPATYDASSHATRANMVWPGFDSTVDPAAPRARPSGDWGKCVNCHDVHGYNMDGTGLTPSLVVSREERLCHVCHDGSPALKNIKADFNSAYRHPVGTSGRHAAAEDGTSSAYGASPTNNRHSECVDCHNPHAARADGSPPVAPGASKRLAGVGRIAVFNGAAGAVPAYTYLVNSHGKRIPLVHFVRPTHGNPVMQLTFPRRTDEGAVVNADDKEFVIEMPGIRLDDQSEPVLRFHFRPARMTYQGKFAL